MLILFEEVHVCGKVGLGCVRDPDADRGAYDPAGSGCGYNANHWYGAVVDPDDAADDPGIGGEAAAPGGLTQDGDRSLARRAAVVFDEKPAELGTRDAFDCKEVAGNAEARSFLAVGNISSPKATANL